MEGVVELPKIEQITETILSNQKIIELLIHSFRLSQGDPKLQGYIFQYLHLKHPDWAIEDNQIVPVLDAAIPVMEKIVFKKRNLQISEKKPYTHHTVKKKQRFMPKDTDPDINDDDIVITADDELNVMYNIINGKYTDPEVKENIRKQSGIFVQENINFTILMIERLMKERDMIFAERGRQLSYFDHFVTKEISTGIVEYDEMMRDIRSLPRDASLVSR